MNFKTRLLIILLLAVLLPMILLALFVRDEMTDRLTVQFERRVESLVSVIEDDLAQEGETIARSLSVIRAAVVDDNRFRRAAVDRVPGERRYLLDYAGSAMQLAGLSMLQIQDETGRIISSGHFRNEYDRMDPGLPGLLASTPGGTALVHVRAPDTPFLALARADTFRMGDRRFVIVAGSRIGRRFLAGLARDEELDVSLVYPGGVLSSLSGSSGSGSDATPAGTGSGASPGAAGEIVRELSVPFIGQQRGGLSSAEFRVIHRLAGLHALRSSIDRWFAIAVAVAVVMAVVVVSWLAVRISRPLVELADKTSRIDIDRLDVDFSTRRRDEIGALSRLLGAMTERLRASAVRIRDAERRATLGEMARQVNHDIKNGLIPIRNVFRHLTRTAETDPGGLPGIIQERRSTIDSSISYLENLVLNYSRFYPRVESRPCDLNGIIRRLVFDLQGPGDGEIRMNLAEGSVVSGDPVSLRRIVENLVCNAVESLESRQGHVFVSTELLSGEGGRAGVRIVVSDTGKGMNEEQRKRIFDDFFTTKEKGTGLGLSIVKRLVMDLGGSISVESREAKGSRFIVDLPCLDDV